MTDAEKNAWNFGYAIACANLINLYDQPSMAAEVMAQTNITLAEIEAMGLTDYDLEPLRTIFREERVLEGRAA